jgi:hypothetical protein
MSVVVPPHLSQREIDAVRRAHGEVAARAYVATMSVLQTHLDEFSDPEDVHPTLRRARQRVAADPTRADFEPSGGRAR